MKTPEERIGELEKRVFILEKELSVKRKMPVVTAPQIYKKNPGPKVIDKKIDLET